MGRSVPIMSKCATLVARFVAASKRSHSGLKPGILEIASWQPLQTMLCAGWSVCSCSWFPWKSLLGACHYCERVRTYLFHCSEVFWILWKWHLDYIHICIETHTLEVEPDGEEEENFPVSPAAQMLSMLLPVTVRSQFRSLNQKQLHHGIIHQKTSNHLTDLTLTFD